MGNLRPARPDEAARFVPTDPGSIPKGVVVSMPAVGLVARCVRCGSLFQLTTTCPVCQFGPQEL